MTYASLDDLRSQLGAPAHSAPSPEYAAKMLHDVPESRVVDRTAFVVELVAGKHVLEFAASGALHGAIVAAAAAVYATDKTMRDGLDEAVDLDDVTLPCVTVSQRVAPDVIVCGELLEHLSNPGWFLERLRRQYTGVPVLITVPNAFAQAARRHMLGAVENVNRDHVCWYSYTTLKTLLGRVGYAIEEHYWYGGVPFLAEGLIVVAQ